MRKIILWAGLVLGACNTPLPGTCSAVVRTAPSAGTVIPTMRPGVLVVLDHVDDTCGFSAGKQALIDNVLVSYAETDTFELSPSPQFGLRGVVSETGEPLTLKGGEAVLPVE